MTNLVIRAVLAVATLFLVFRGVQSLSATPLDATSSATGVVHVVLSDRDDPDCGSTCAQRLAMNAVSADDGGAVGQFELFSEEGGGIRVHGSINCLSVEGNEAQLGGVITQSDIPDLIGLQVTWLVVDNGEGQGSPDQTTDLFGGNCESDIRSHPRFELFDVIQGNIQVRD